MKQIPDAAVQAALEYYSEGGCMGLDSYERKEVATAMLEAALPHLQIGFKVQLLSATDAAHHHREKNKKLRKRNRALLTALREVVASKTLHDANFIANIAIAGWEDDELIHKARNATSLATKPVDVAAVTKPVNNIESRTPKEVFDIMCDRIRALSAEPAQGEP